MMVSNQLNVICDGKGAFGFSEVIFKNITGKELSDFLNTDQNGKQSLVRKVYQSLHKLVESPQNQEMIRTY